MESKTQKYQTIRVFWIIFYSLYFKNLPIYEMTKTSPYCWRAYNLANKLLEYYNNWFFFLNWGIWPLDIVKN